MNWPLAQELVRQDHFLARYQEGDNLETPLFVECQNQPPETLVIQLLQAWPDAVITKSRQGDLPLHIACRYKAAHGVIQSLIQACPETSCRRTRYGTTPLVALWEDTTRQQQQQSDDANDDEARRIRNAWNVIHDMNTDMNEKLAALPVTMNDEYKRQVTMSLLQGVAQHRKSRKAAASDNAPHNDTLYYLHAAVSLGFTGCPAFILLYAFSQFPEQILLRDHDGRLPLHIAVGPDNSSLPHSLRKFRPLASWSIKLSLHFHPLSASRIDPNECSWGRRYPLHTALMYRHEWRQGVAELTRASSHVLSIPDPVTGLLPFLLASAVHDTKTTTDQCGLPHDVILRRLDTTFHLLRADPSVLQQLGWNKAASEEAPLWKSWGRNNMLARYIMNFHRSEND